MPSTKRRNLIYSIALVCSIIAFVTFFKTNDYTTRRLGSGFFRDYRAERERGKEKRQHICAEINAEKLKVSSSFLRQTKNIEDENEMICGRSVPSPFRYKDFTLKETYHGNQKKMLVFGFDKYRSGNNNRILAILRGIDYAVHNGFKVTVTRGGWAHNILRTFFWDSTVFGDERYYAWEKLLEHQLGISIMDSNEILCMGSMEGYKMVFKKATYMFSSKPRRTEKDLKKAFTRRQSILQFLWSNPARNSKSGMGDMCSVAEKIITEPTMEYSVVHLRWLEGQCNERTQRLSENLQIQIKRRVGRSILPGILDSHVTCEMSPEYIKDILMRRKSLDKPLFVITDGQKPEVLEKIRQDETLSKILRPIPDELSWVGGDMMLAILSNTFIGSPVSSMSEMISASRIALGYEPSTNFMYPREKLDDADGSRRDFFFKNEFVTSSSYSMLKAAADFKTK